MINAERQNTKVVTGRVRLNFVNIFHRKAAAPGEDPKYSLQLLIPKSETETINNINEAIDAAKKAGASIWEGTIPGNLKNPLKDGDLEKAEQREYAGHYFIRASTKYRPGVLGKDGKEILDETEVYPGCIGRVSLSFYPFRKDNDKGVGCALLNVLKLAEGEPLGRSRAEDDFADEFLDYDILR